MFSLFAKNGVSALRSLPAKKLVNNELLLGSYRLFHETPIVATDFHENDKLSYANSATQTLIASSHGAPELRALAPLFEHGGYDPNIRLSRYALTRSERRKRHMIAAILSTHYLVDDNFVELVRDISNTVHNPLSDKTIKLLHQESTRQIKGKYDNVLDTLPLSKYLLDANKVAGFVLSPSEMREATYMLMANQLTQQIVDKLCYQSIAPQIKTLESTGDLICLPSTTGSNLTIGIVGGVGSGKSTIINPILSHFLENTTSNGIESAAFISSDTFKLLLYAENPWARKYNGGTLTHEESKSMFNLALSVRYQYSRNEKPAVTIIERISFKNSDLALLENDKNTSLLMLGTNRGNLEKVVEGVKKRARSNAQDPRVVSSKLILTSYKRVANSLSSIAEHDSPCGSVFKLYDTDASITAKFSSTPDSVTPLPAPSPFAELSVKEKTLSIYNIAQLIDFIKHKHINIQAKSSDELYLEPEKISLKELLNELLMDLPGYRFHFYANAKSSEKLAVYEENVFNILNEEKYSIMKRKAPKHFEALEEIMTVSKTPSFSL